MHASNESVGGVDSRSSGLGVRSPATGVLYGWRKETKGDTYANANCIRYISSPTKRCCTSNAMVRLAVCRVNFAVAAELTQTDALPKPYRYWGISAVPSAICPIEHALAIIRERLPGRHRLQVDARRAIKEVTLSAAIS